MLVKNYLYTILLIALLASCSSTKFVPKGEYLLSRVKVNIDNKKVSKSAVEGVLQQKPIKKFVGIPFSTWIYSMSDSTGNTRLKRWFNKTFQKLGEAPVIFDSTLYETSVNSVRLYLKSKGYYNAVVKDTVVFEGAKASVFVDVKTNRPYRIKKMQVVGDSSLSQIIKKDSLSSFLHAKMIFDTDMLEKERERVALLLRNKGYFFFNKTYVVYEADSTVGNREVSITQIVKNPMVYSTIADSTREQVHEKYTIKEVNVFTNYDRVEALTNKSYLNSFVENRVDGVSIWSNGPRNVTPNLVLRALKIRPGDFYSQKARSETDDNFSDLKIFRTTDIQFSSVENSRKAEMDTALVTFVQPKELACNIYLSPMPSQGYKLEGEMYLSSDYWGLEGNLGYMHRNLFKGAELFNINLNGSIPFSRRIDGSTATELSQSTELGVSASINIPRFLMPFNISKLFKTNAPRTQFSVGYNYQSRTIYTRNLLNFGFGYNWMMNQNVSVSYSPINLNIIKMYNDDKLYDYLKDQLLLRTAFSDHFISSGKFSITYNNQKISGLGSYYYATLNAELAGNVVSLFNSGLKKGKLTDGSESYLIWGMPYSQFFSVDFTTVYNARLDSKNRLVYRIQIGAAFPYGNATALPYERYFYVGGANSMRGWQVRTLGPGALPENDDKNRLFQIGDFKIEGNVEYRYKLFWSFEGALFADVGNIWFLPRNKLGEDASKYVVFHIDSFYKQLAADAGVGLRLNLGYLIVRLDSGFRMFDPSKEEGKRFLPANGFSRRDISYHIGIGYPF